MIHRFILPSKRILMIDCMIFVRFFEYSDDYCALDVGRERTVE